VGTAKKKSCFRHSDLSEIGAMKRFLSFGKSNFYLFLFHFDSVPSTFKLSPIVLRMNTTLQTLAQKSNKVILASISHNIT